MGQMDKKTHIIIVGAGFGGIQAAKLLANTAAQITIIDKHNYHLFQPLLYQVATAGLSEKDIACPIRTIFRDQKNIEFHMDEVIDIDLADNRVITITGHQIPFDYLVVATGSTNNFFGMESLAKNALCVKTLGQSVATRDHIIKMFELAAHEPDLEKRHSLLTFVVVGGGPTGVECAGALSELIHFVLAKEYHNLNFKEVRIMLVEASDALLPVMPLELQEATAEILLRKHIEVRLLVQVSGFDGNTLLLKGGEVIPTHTVIWAAGVCATKLLDNLKQEQDRAHRVVVNEYLHIQNKAEVFIIGDAAHFEQENSPLPMVAPVAIQQAGVVAQNIISLMNGRPLQKFVYRPVGTMATIGRNAAVVNIGKFKSQGFIAWIIWSLMHMLRLVHFRNRTVVFMKWIWEYLTYDRVEHVINRD
ncbi:NADH dehydrogenase-like protein YjlD [Sporomusa ovata DSM 2662]|uniref:NADH:ubiquinone reductase (non-electrogenic) n=1 Tax=Sporomusa ovata TaxID=2378 RepID=A0A0U1L1V6_9FIRM|nr:FAD-dependent oxidoreductase [Sporomusa ovata]EQB25090.1 pyridine nucleotide-disulfide oxidoreductase, FAD/NAD(P)-binding domain-containing protein [Sporomusa ovata DSM 2662]CQR73641.1 NADH dehydrogenase [Sporomusa ovata]